MLTSTWAVSLFSFALCLAPLPAPVSAVPLDLAEPSAGLSCDGDAAQSSSLPSASKDLSPVAKADAGASETLAAPVERPSRLSVPRKDPPPLTRGDGTPQGRPEEPPAASPTASVAATPAKPARPSTGNQAVDDHCNRFDDDAGASKCRRAVFRCSGMVARDAKVADFLACVDRVQICITEEDPFKSLQSENDACIARATRCQQDPSMPLGDLKKLSDCKDKTV
ncbi:hypothetical protein DCS_03248 [Drechmeria coniospora]|uniref:Uncharacterized protein n=1 Tax=Drechmeria coniospora TaxID=98403 RepID=A0A151GYJ3_DRECN|nr:hypothetical protein DCS_03248 [Drechmeria coniospora]KYK62103.1 hypothetical protein DCS_03248 [Drechmeria coniospora]ODA81339.1 hypothetical protein RJ55_04304 [Drechmeria coniospora]